jgi:hypothetical protein
VPYRVAADLLVVVHLLFVLFVATGGLLVLRWRPVAWLHVPAAAWGAFVELTGRICPLTPLENHFRALAGLETYSGTFIDRHLVPVLYPDGLTAETQLVLGIAVIVGNAALYALAWRSTV